MFRHVPRLLVLRVHWCAFGCAVAGLSLLLWLDSVQGHDSGKEDIGKLSEFAYAKTVTVALGGGVKMEFVLIPQGRFQMGSPQDENGHCDDEQLHAVSITRPFYLGRYTVTRGQFRQFVADSGHKTDAEKDGQGGWGYDADSGKFKQDPKYTWRAPGFEQTDEHPVVNVSWHDSQAFCDWLSRKEGKKYRLPTEAQWEYACRGRTQTRFYFGDDEEDLAKYGNVADASARKKFPAWSWTIKADDGYVFTAPVGHYKPNGFGLYDLHGNVWQWCADYYDAQYYANSPMKDPFNSKKPDSERRVLRGGSWNLNPTFCRAAIRLRFAPEVRFFSYGFRVCLSLD